MGPYVRAKDLAKIFGITVEQVYQWAHRDAWRRVETWPRGYSMEDAEETYCRITGKPSPRTNELASHRS